MSQQWHPLFAHLLRKVVEDYYDVETEFPVGDLPRKADILLLERKTRRRAPFTGLWRHLTAWNVLEFKGPTVASRDDDLELLFEVGLGVARRLNEERGQQGERKTPRHRISFWYICASLGKKRLTAWQRLLGKLHKVSGGIWRAAALGYTIYIVAWDLLPLDTETLPLQVLRPASNVSVEQLLTFVLGDAGRTDDFGPSLTVLHPEILKQHPKMSQALRKMPNVDFKPLVDILGIERMIDVIGVDRLIGELGVKRMIDELGVKRMIDEVGVKRMIDEVGVKRMIDEVGVKRIIDEVGLSRLLAGIDPAELASALSPEQLRRLKAEQN